MGDVVVGNRRFRAEGERRLAKTNVLLIVDHVQRVCECETRPEIARILLLHPPQKLRRVDAHDLHPLGKRHQQLHRLITHDGCLGQMRQRLL